MDVDPQRLARWLDNFAGRHGPPQVGAGESALLLTAPDGATAELYGPPGAPMVPDLAAFVGTATASRRIGLLLARKSAMAVGIADGEQLVVSKVETRYVQGRTAAGGWSQQRFARRRDNQTKAALGDAADLAVRLLLPEAGTLAALVCGGDRRAVDTVLADRRLAPLLPLRAERLLDVPEPRHAVLVDAVGAARAVRVLVREPQQV